MVTLRCTRKLLARLGIKDPGEPGPPTANLGDWYGTIVYTRPSHLLVFVNEASLLAIVLHARELHTLVPRFQQMLVELLTRLGIPQEHIDAELARMNPITFGPTISRTVLGVLNQACADMKLSMDVPPELTIYDWTWRLSATPWSPIRYQRQEDVARRLLGAPPRLRLVPNAHSPFN